MASKRLDSQPDLFGSAAEALDAPFECEPFDEEYIEEVRAGLLKTLALATDAAVLPWSDFTKAGIAELHFNSMTNLLPAEEGVELRRLFAVELDRLYGDDVD